MHGYKLVDGFGILIAASNLDDDCSYLAPLGDLGLFNDLDGHRKQVFCPFSCINCAKSTLAQKRTHPVCPLKRLPLMSTHDGLEVRSEIRREMAANAHRDICKKKFPAEK